jgi:uncharacterized repeat protein (TIGR03803 family)
VLYNFAGGADGSNPNGHLVEDNAGNFYGTTFFGGSSNVGTIFKVDSTGAETVLYTFTGGTDGSEPWAGLFRDPGGDLFGTTDGGGASGLGTIFKLDTSGTLTTLHNFKGGLDGSRPESRLISVKGQLYGTTRLGGSSAGDLGLGCGIIFRVSHSGNERVLYRFSGMDDGCDPQGLVADSAGNLYGIANFSNLPNNVGTVFKLNTSGVFSVLYTFSGNADGGHPIGRPLIDVNGNVHGATASGGDQECPGGCGLVFQVDPAGRETIVHPLFGGTHGGTPDGGLLDLAGTLIGTSEFFGDLSCTSTFPPGCGVLYQISNRGHFTVLHAFAGGADGDTPAGDPVRGKDGSIYGITTHGGTGTACDRGCGVIFKYTP